MKTLLINWEILAALAATSWAIISFVLTRRRDLAWKRTEFIVQQSEFLDNDKEMRECTLILYGKHPKLMVDDFIKAASGSSPGTDHDGQLVIMFEKYLNFLWRIAYAHLVLGTLTKIDLCAFGYYFNTIGTHRKLREHCLQEGYEEIITAADILKASD